MQTEAGKLTTTNIPSIHAVTVQLTNPLLLPPYVCLCMFCEFPATDYFIIFNICQDMTMMLMMANNKRVFANRFKSAAAEWLQSLPSMDIDPKLSWTSICLAGWLTKGGFDPLPPLPSSVVPATVITFKQLQFAHSEWIHDPSTEGVSRTDLWGSLLQLRILLWWVVTRFMNFLLRTLVHSGSMGRICGWWGLNAPTPPQQF